MSYEVRQRASHFAHTSDRIHKRLQQNLTSFGQQQSPDFPEDLADITQLSE
ncbi:hypothetical protein H6F98_26855 [Microcoleus sp. FACHB-SPT15]|uniref:hypothetical protein n=1 Tax=Microcoleus sp. FACHB-SPT15 TaxID=2692830 RepID=UPI0017839342|nr:hypothetical protein [Microcoleus sp. FACHB-SPT15]MBD1809047.1 hypothetical protein [Microcoleus sp. FACHB-SPT15]